ncbi:hypothetical protein CDAR_276751 [Caerostris darwini]|uniref:Uncharacterized protein n=1 Tax=Caerostris darwini TaxID=1538125 RepID=A0AAV4RUM4_9ARAC|nr:hypothetical protein CDAR_276751 [Caerostris darwini]
MHLTAPELATSPSVARPPPTPPLPFPATARASLNRIHYMGMFDLEVIHADLPSAFSSSLFITHICFTCIQTTNTLIKPPPTSAGRAQTSLEKPQVSLKQDRPDAPDRSTTCH